MYGRLTELAAVAPGPGGAGDGGRDRRFVLGADPHRPGRAVVARPRPRLGERGRGVVPGVRRDGRLAAAQPADVRQGGAGAPPDVVLARRVRRGAGTGEPRGDAGPALRAVWEALRFRRAQPLPRRPGQRGLAP